MPEVKKLFFVLILSIVLPAHSQQLGPEELVNRVTEEVLAAIKGDTQLAAGDRQKMLKLADEKVLPHFDFEEAARLAVGRSWARADPNQRKQIAAEFRAMLVRTYASAIEAYGGQTMQVLPVRMKPDDTDVTVRNRFLRPGRTAVMIEYQMRRTAQGWKIYDIAVEGVSLVITYRSEFDAVVRQDGIEGLIKRLAEKNAPPKPR